MGKCIDVVGIYGIFFIITFIFTHLLRHMGRVIAIWEGCIKYEKIIYLKKFINLFKFCCHEVEENPVDTVLCFNF